MLLTETGAGGGAPPARTAMAAARPADQAIGVTHICRSGPRRTVTGSGCRRQSRPATRVRRRSPNWIDDPHGLVAALHYVCIHRGFRPVWCDCLTDPASTASLSGTGGFIRLTICRTSWHACRDSARPPPGFCLRSYSAVTGSNFATHLSPKVISGAVG